MMKEYICIYDEDEMRYEPNYDEMIVRCKDCKHYDGYCCNNKWWGGGYGNYTPPIKSEKGFCDWAERKEDA